MQTAYKLEVFGQDIVFKDKAVLGSPEINFDYLTLESSKITVKKINVAKGDYIHITNFSGDVVYQGIVKDAGGDKDTSEINVAPLLSIFDVKASFDRTDLETVSLEAFIASIITDLYIDNDDDLQNITGLSVEVLSNTYGATIGLEKNIEELYTIITSALMAYGIIVTPVLYPQTKELKVTIGTATATAIKIEADLDNVTERKFVIGDGYGAVNKFTLINQDDESQQITFYLHMDGTVSTADTDRVTPVFASFEYIGSNDFETNSESRAVKTLSPQQYNNLIELQYSIGDKLIKASSVAIGTPANIISGGNTYRSILTGFDKFGDAIRLVFGIVRIDIHKKLILEKRSGAAVTVSGTGSGDVVGPASALNGTLAIFSGTTGKLLADSGIAAADMEVEEGAWAPILYGHTTAGTPTYIVQVGEYLRIGRLCYASYNVIISNKGGIVGRIRIGGLPFPMWFGSGADNEQATVASANGVTSSSLGLAARLFGDSTFINVMRSFYNTTLQLGYLQNTDVNDALQLKGVAVYKIAE